MKIIKSIIGWIVLIAITAVFIYFTAGSLKSFMADSMKNLNTNIRTFIQKSVHGGKINVDFRNSLPNFVSEELFTEK